MSLPQLQRAYCKEKQLELKWSFQTDHNLSLFVFAAKPPKKTSENFKEATWQKLKEAVQAIHKKTFVIYSSEELYKTVENMCSHKMAATLYDLLETECESHVKSNLQQFV